MKKWYLWLVFALIYALSGAINYMDGKSIIGAIVQVGIVTVLAVAQLVCDRKGEKGKMVFKYIAAVVSIVLVAWMIWMIFGIFI